MKLATVLILALPMMIAIFANTAKSDDMALFAGKTVVFDRLYNKRWHSVKYYFGRKGTIFAEKITGQSRPTADFESKGTVVKLGRSTGVIKSSNSNYSDTKYNCWSAIHGNKWESECKAKYTWNDNECEKISTNSIVLTANGCNSFKKDEWKCEGQGWRLLRYPTRSCRVYEGRR